VYEFLYDLGIEGKTESATGDAAIVTNL